jgi:hypothetical protein
MAADDSIEDVMPDVNNAFVKKSFEINKLCTSCDLCRWFAQLRSRSAVILAAFAGALEYRVIDHACLRSADIPRLSWEHRRQDC